MKRLITLLLAAFVCLGLFGCGSREPAQIAATTLPVYEFTSLLCQGTGIRVTRLITESVSCLHDYTLQVSQMRAMEAAEYIVISGAGLEDFLEIDRQNIIDASQGIALLCHEEPHGHGHGEEHNHDSDPHIWLSPDNARQMARNIYTALASAYPEQAATFESNWTALEEKFIALEAYAEQQLRDLSGRQIVTFHDGFGYMAKSFDLEILQAMEEESGSEASAAELKELIGIVRTHHLKAIFTEVNGSPAAASIISAETGAEVFALDMAMGGDSYFDAMYYNIDVLREALA